MQCRWNQFLAWYPNFADGSQLWKELDEAVDHACVGAKLARSGVHVPHGANSSRSQQKLFAESYRAERIGESQNWALTNQASSSSGP
jgi:hypothetical protein